MGGAFSACMGLAYQVGRHHVAVRGHLGDGGFSVVELVQEGNESFALKIMTCLEKSDEQRALQEVDIYGKFNHANIIKLIDHGTKPSATQAGATDVLMLFPAYPRGTLEGKVAKMAKINEYFLEHTALVLFQGICLAIREFHETGYVHRDLKLGNVLLDERDRPIVMDFGSVVKAKIEVNSRKEALQQTEMAAQHSTMPYRAPELFEVESECVLTEKTDIWSLGCLLYALCYRETPFEAVAGNTGSLALAVAQGKIKWPEHDPYSQDLRDLITEMLTLDPVERPDISQVLNKVSTLL
eukprot:m.342825 g.342825  ORF g.342825 m.342825 type:complete len:297 (-) comp21881_c0_seq1:79-969(-)